VAAVLQLGGDASGVVVAHEGQRQSARAGLPELVEEALVAAERVRELEEVPVAQRGPDRLPQLVLGDRVRAGGGGEGRVLTMDDLAEDPRLGMRGSDPL